MYIVAYDRSQKRYVRYINPDIEIDKFFVNDTELKNLVNSELKGTEVSVKYVAKSDTAPAAE